MRDGVRVCKTGTRLHYTVGVTTEADHSVTPKKSNKSIRAQSLTWKRFPGGRAIRFYFEP